MNATCFEEARRVSFGSRHVGRGARRVPSWRDAFMGERGAIANEHGAVSRRRVALSWKRVASPRRRGAWRRNAARGGGTRRDREGTRLDREEASRVIAETCRGLAETCRAAAERSAVAREHAVFPGERGAMAPEHGGRRRNEAGTGGTRPEPVERAGNRWNAPGTGGTRREPVERAAVFEFAPHRLRSMDGHMSPRSFRRWGRRNRGLLPLGGWRGVICRNLRGSDVDFFRAAGTALAPAAQGWSFITNDVREDVDRGASGPSPKVRLAGCTPLGDGSSWWWRPPLARVAPVSPRAAPC